MTDAVKKNGLWSADQQSYFPLITKSGINKYGKIVHYYFNYPAGASSANYPHKSGKEFLSGEMTDTGKALQLAAWEIKIIEEQ